MNDELEAQASSTRFQAAINDRVASEARKAAADLELEAAIIRNEKAKAGADWRERKCGECGFGVTYLETTIVRGILEAGIPSKKFTCELGFCRKNSVVKSAASFSEDPACPDFVPREVTK